MGFLRRADVAKLLDKQQKERITERRVSEQWE
jgi:hypothetical protein